MTWTRIAAALGFLGVSLGAFGAHGLESRATPEQLEWWGTATLYLLIHVAPLLALEPLAARGRPVDGAGRAFVAGVAIFSGSLYAMGLGAPRWFGAITPIGGVAFLVGWVLLYRAGGSSSPESGEADTAGRATRAQ